MVSALADIISRYRGPVDRVRCLAHIINLVVQVVLRQFDKPKKKKKPTNQKSEKAREQRQELEDDSDAEKEGVEEEEDGEAEIDEMDVRDGEDDMVDGIEEVEAAMKQDKALADEHVKPIRQVLSKVSSA